MHILLLAPVINVAYHLNVISKETQGMLQ